MDTKLYKGKQSGKTHLEVNGVTLATDLVDQFPFVTLLAKPYSVRDLRQYLYPYLS